MELNGKKKEKNSGASSSQTLQANMRTLAFILGEIERHWRDEGKEVTEYDLCPSV